MLILKGIGASPGKVKGHIWIFDSDKEPKGEVICLKSSDSKVLDLVLEYEVKGVISEKGGVGSHLAIVARELGIPCVVSVKNATKILRNGDLVEIDGRRGTVKKVR